MTTKTLARDYGPFSPEERLPLILGAVSRGDEVELARLKSASPSGSAQVFDYHGRLQGFHFAAFVRLAEALAFAAWFFRLLDLAEQEGAEEGEVPDRCWNLCRYYAYLVRVHADAWGEFLDRFLVGDELRKKYPGVDTLKTARALAETIAFSQEEADTFVVGLVGPDHLAPRTESLLSRMHETVAKFSQRWLCSTLPP